APVAGARVRYASASDLRQRASERFDAQVTGADGAFAFDAVASGSFRFLASHPERAPAVSPIVSLDGVHARADLVIAMAAGATVRGHVVDARHQPVAGARVRIGPARPGLEAAREATSDVRGAFEVRGLPRAPLSAIALHDAGASQPTAIDATAGDVADAVLSLALTGVIAGRVVDRQGAPIAGAQVSALPGELVAGAWRLRGLPEGVTDGSGRFQLTGLADGSYTVSAAHRLAQLRGRRPRSDAAPSDTATARTGDRNVELVLAPEGSVRGVLAFADGTSPALFTAGTPGVEQAFTGGQLALAGLAPGSYPLTVRGPGFQPRTLDVTIAAGATTDLGTITVAPGRAIAGTVIADGAPVPGATVYAGRNILGSGASASSPVSAATQTIARATRTATTDARGGFTLAGFGDGDLAIVAERPDLGRSRAIRLTALAPDQDQLVLTLEPFGALHGTCKPAGDAPVLITCQSTSTPGAVFTVLAGADGAYRFDRLAPDTYKVSATLGTIRTGLHFYAKQAAVASGQDVALDLSVDPGAVSLAVTLQVADPGLAIVWLAAGAISAATESELAARLAAGGPGAYQRATARGGAATLPQVAPGAYTLCAVPLPREVQGTAAIEYVDQHGSGLPAFCQPVTVAATPASQAVQIAVQVPPVIGGP
ncbi:MAG TPA: carboxypeptidase-like regulatory domain-containing protein, partial [Kofleriaceae bacterium]